MYSGGGAYRDLTLTAFGQRDAVFALANDYWLLVGLDTGTVDGRLSLGQRTELQRLANGLGRRRMLLLSHHPPYSPLSRTVFPLLDDVRDLLVRGCVTAWYWAHDHAFMRFEPDPEYGVHGRCVGHGAFPYLRPDRELSVVGRSGPLTLRAMDTTEAVPNAALLDGPNGLMSPTGRYGPAGWLALSLDGPTLVEQAVDDDGVRRFEAIVC
jgi:hypothetical protein